MPRPPADDELFLSTADGVRLEAAQVVPPNAAGTLVACHPHPLFGGTMTNKVIHSLYKVFRDAGFASLRFNFRGAGASTGSHGHGVLEEQDVAAAWQHQMGSLADGVNYPRVLGGFSFGSVVGLRYAARCDSCTHRVGIGIPLQRGHDFAFLTNPDPRPLYLLAGTQDEFCPETEFRALVNQARTAGNEVHAVLVPDANHFFDRLGHVLRQEMERIANHILGRDIPPTNYPVIQL